MIKDIAIGNQIEWHYAPMIKLLTTRENQPDTKSLSLNLAQ